MLLRLGFVLSVASCCLLHETVVIDDFELSIVDQCVAAIITRYRNEVCCPLLIVATGSSHGCLCVTVDTLNAHTRLFVQTQRRNYSDDVIWHPFTREGAPSLKKPHGLVRDYGKRPSTVNTAAMAVPRGM